MLKMDRAGRVAMQFGAALLWLSSFASLAGAEPVYRYETEEGTVSFSDDLKKVPSRYLAQVETRSLRPLQDYARFTPEDGDPSYSERLATRLAALRARQAERELEARAAAPAAGTLLSLRTGGRQAPTLDLDTRSGADPVMVETLFTRPEGKLVTRQSVVVRQGDQILAIVKPRLREWNVNEDIHDEELFER